MSNYPEPTPGYTPPQSNGLGLGGFITSLIGMVLCFGIPCPIGAILSFCALFKAPRGFAIAGVVLGVLGTALWTLLILMAIGVIGSGMNWFTGQYSTLMTHGNMSGAAYDIDHHYTQNQQQLPDDAAGKTIVAAHMDYWGNAMDYRKVDAMNFELISAGPDGAMGTTDDITMPFVAGMNTWNNSGMQSSAPAVAKLDGTGGFAEAHDAVHQTYGGQHDSPSVILIQPMLENAHLDQWGSPIVYSAGAGPTYRLTSAGPDGVMGNDDDVVRRYTLDQTGEIPEVDASNGE